MLIKEENFLDTACNFPLLFGNTILPREKQDLHSSAFYIDLPPGCQCGVNIAIRGVSLASSLKLGMTR